MKECVHVKYVASRKIHMTLLNAKNVILRDQRQLNQCLFDLSDNSIELRENLHL
jgi:hypothetical protein